MRSSKSLLVAVGVVAVALLIVLGQTLYVVGQTEQAVVLRFGEPVRVVNQAPPGDNNANARQDTNAGLQAKWPFVETVVKFDRRAISLEPPAEEVLASNQERLVVDSFMRYRIVDPLRFYQSLNRVSNAQSQLQSMVNSSLREALGAATTEQIISTDRPEIMQLVRADVERRAAASNYGVEIVDLRIKRADLPEENAERVFNRMRTQREQEAAEIRARGEQQAQEIRATATREAETTRGEGNAERARILADSYNRDPSFAGFYRTMRAYEESLANGDTTLVLSPDSDFFGYFSNGSGG